MDFLFYKFKRAAVYAAPHDYLSVYLLPELSYMGYYPHKPPAAGKL